ncbi:uncharacterized protein LOC110691462 [Chenopodium quinoa]|uniref:uncharacterized protein LOC110691462 n=1 Tax=Chenopodium quinoa TaxID=63459 RepID=UPI000B77A219|nr:uncharacterized protein LOC110691462 [Chenopodium quinoa]
MEEEDSASTLAWSWVIEALAKSQLVDATLLYELVSKTPPLLGESGRKAREATALRCLEGLFSPSNVSSKNHVASDWSKFGFDPAESCEAAIQRLLRETSGFKGASDELNCNTDSFLKHKKASLPKSTLELLKDMIVEDTHPLAASLKEVSGLAVGDQCVLDIPFDGGDPTSPPLRSDEDDHVEKTMLAEENGCSPISGIDNQLRQAYLANGKTSSRGGVSSNHTDNHMQELEAASHDMDNLCPPGKKLKLDKEYGMQSKHQHSAPVDSNQMCNNAEDGQYHEVIRVNAIYDSKSYGKDDEQSKTYAENHDQQQISPNNGNAEAVQYHEVIKVNAQHDGKSYGIDDEQPKTSVENHDQQQISHNNDDHFRKEIDLAMKNHNFPSSQCVLTGDSLEMTETQTNLCMKCNKDGQLLSCSASSCPLLFHESCLGCSASFDDLGNFYCPFCAYSRAMSEYVRAKEKVSLARKELSLFIGGRTRDFPERDGDSSSGDDVNLGKHKNVDKTAEVKKAATFVNQAAKSHQTSLKGKQLELTHSSAYMNVNRFVMATQQHISFQDRQGAEIIIQLSRNPSQIWNKDQDDHRCDGVKLSGDNNELKLQGKLTRCKITEFREDASSESISDSDGPQQDKGNDGTCSLACRRPLRAIPGSPVGRRKKIRWTAEEEETLKKGVEIYDQGNGRTILWKSILEYGDSVFRKGRTAVDLKDKWRNITRGTSPKVN